MLTPPIPARPQPLNKDPIPTRIPTYREASECEQTNRPCLFPQLDGYIPLEVRCNAGRCARPGTSGCTSRASNGMI